MSEYQSNLTLTEASQIIWEADHIGITAHAKPDGDAFGSGVALAAGLNAAGKKTTLRLIPPIPHQFRSLRGWDLVEPYEHPTSLDKVDRMIVLDTGAWSQMTQMKPDLTPILDRTLIIDHHLTGDIPAKWRYIDGKAAACCEIVGQLIEQLQILAGNTSELWTGTVCEALFVGLASDTGWFRFSNTRSESHELAGRLLRLGVDQSKLYSLLEQNERPQKLSLWIRAMESIRLVADQKAAVMVLKTEDFSETGARLEETERFVDVPQVVASVQVVVMITQVPPTNGQNQPINKSSAAPELPKRQHPSTDTTTLTEKTTQKNMQPESVIRLSFRSKPGTDPVNVATLAQQFGGGGHARAAGAQLTGSLDEVIQRIVDAISGALNNSNKK